MEPLIANPPPVDPKSGKPTLTPSSAALAVFPSAKTILVFGPLGILCAALMHYGGVTPQAYVWLGVYLGHLLARQLAIAAGLYRPERIARFSVPLIFSALNAILLGCLAPLNFLILDDMRFLALTFMVITFVAPSVMAATHPAMSRLYLLFTLAPFSLFWFLRPGEISWIMGGVLMIACYSYLTIARSVWARWLERLDLEKDLADQVAQLDRLNHSRTSLLAAACHDLRQPTHGMGLLLESMINGAGPISREKLQLLQRSNAMSANMLSALMDLTRLDAGGFAATPTPIALSEVFDEVRMHFDILARMKDLQLHVSSTSLYAQSDAHLLRRIVFNLVSNAIKFTRTGGVTVTAAVSDDEPGTLIVSVADTGIGIPQDRHADIFEEYVRLDQKTEGMGMGIGLSVVSRACALLGHRISLVSKPGAGTTVSVILRVAAGDDVAARLETRGVPFEATTMGGARTMIALVEDDPDIRRAAVDLLTGRDYEVIAAGSLSELLAKLTQSMQTPAMLMSDLHIDADDGFDVASTVRALPGLSMLPVLLVTGDLSPAIDTRAREHRIVVLHKPVRPQQLLTAIETMVARQH